MGESFRYNAAQLLAVKKFFDLNPDGTIKVPVWTKPVYTRDEWKAWFRKCLHTKINRESSIRGRKDSMDWFCQMRRSQWEINQPRLVIHWLPKDLKSRFAHRLTQPGDYL
jgi:hypothetical protein